MIYINWEPDRIWQDTLKEERESNCSKCAHWTLNLGSSTQASDNSTRHFFLYQSTAVQPGGAISCQTLCWESSSGGRQCLLSTWVNTAPVQKKIERHWRHPEGPIIFFLYQQMQLHLCNSVMSHSPFFTPYSFSWKCWKSFFGMLGYASLSNIQRISPGHP